MKTIILRHRRENLKKCSLSGLEKEKDLLFYTYPTSTLPDLKQAILLKVGAPVLTKTDAHRPLLLIDGTWKLALKMEKNLPIGIEARSLPPGFKTAYPRRQTECPDADAGLASIEALFIAHLLLGRPTTSLLDYYYWKEEFLSINQMMLHTISLL